MKKLLTLTAIMVAAILLFTQCRNEGSELKPTNDILPTRPNYADNSQWYVTERQGVADVFYIISTETGDYPLANGSISHFADTYNDSVRQPMKAEMEGVDTLISGKLNYYSPYYRQCSLQSFTSDSLARARMAIALDDVRRSFKYYLDHINNGRPFVLAGFSQGAMILLELLQEMDDKTFSKMVAAYVIGASVSEEMAENCPRIVAAQGAEDTGVTICYNSVRDADCALFAKSAFAINPVGWTTDETPGLLITEPSPLIPVSEQKKDTITVHLDKASQLLFVEGYSADDYVLPIIGKEGNYHSREIWLYRDLLKENIALRTKRKMN
ncbi:MAG: DUF3089 domain-containing protein [Prevotella sp.]|nr:DUF3089 domain-containing protein [Prevotella sp.]